MTSVTVEDEREISLAELCRCCLLPAEHVLTMIEYGVVEPLQPHTPSSQWLFTGNSILRVQTAVRLQSDLDVNLAGAVLALELLDEVKMLRQQVAALQRK